MSLAKKPSDSEHDSSAASSSQVSSSESDSDEEDDKPPAPAQTAPVEGLLSSGCIIIDCSEIISE